MTSPQRAPAGSTRRGYVPIMLEALAALGGSFAVTVLVTWPLVQELGGQIYGLGGDSFGGMASFRLWADEVGSHLTGVSHVDSWGAPFGFDQANGVNVQSAAVFFPAYVVTELVSEIWAYNVVVLSGLTLSGAAMYWLARRIGCGYFAAAWAGLAYIVFPWHLEKAQGHPSLAHLEGFPLLFLALLAWHSRPDIRRALLVAGAVGLLWTTSGYFGLIALVALIVPLGAAAYFDWRRVGWARSLKRVAVPGIGALVVSGLVYVLASSGAGSDAIAPPRPVGELETYGARWWEFVVPAANSARFGDTVDDWLAARLHGSNFSETSLYLGWLTLALAVAFVVWAIARRGALRPELRYATVAFGGTALVGILFSLPSPVVGDVPGPSQLIWEVTPQFRVPSRFVALVMTGLVPLAALGLNGVTAWVSGRLEPGRLGQLAGAAVCVAAGIVTFVELATSPPAQMTDLDPLPSEYAVVDRLPQGSLAEYPLASTEHGITSDYLFYRRAHGRRLLNGAPPGSFADDIRQTLVDPTTPGTAESLATMGVTGVVVRPNTYAFTGGPLAVPSTLGHGYRLLRSTPAGNSVWRVIARPASALAAFGPGFYAAETPAAGSTMRWMGTTGKVQFFASRAGTYRADFSAGTYGRPRVVRIKGRDRSEFVFLTPTQRARSLVLDLPAGRSSVEITARPAAEALPDGRQASAYVSNWRLTPVPPPRGQEPLASSPFPA